MTSKQLLGISILLTCGLHAQHDPGRNSMRMIAKGNLDKAAEEIATKPKGMNSDVDAAERAYVRAMLAVLKDDKATALKEIKAAMDAGMEVDRFIAGPREVFGKLHDDRDFIYLMAHDAKPLVHGPMLGCVTDTSVKIWVRSATEGTIQTFVGEAPLMDDTPLIESNKVKATANTDFTAVVSITGLKPNTKYNYYVTVDDLGGDKTHEFRTQPESGKPAKLSVAFGGGSGYTPDFEHMWTTIKKQETNALILLGDNVYIDDPEHQLTQKYCYYRRQSQPLWRELVKGVGIYAIYDDHDFSINDCIPGPEIAEPAWKPEVWKTFANNWNNPAYGGGEKQPGCWFTFNIGDVQFIMLDGRYYRDLKGGSMLGPVQKEWLFKTLKESTATFKVLASPVPWAPGVKPGSKDTWDGFNDEREEIFSFIEENKINGVLLMAADRHRTDMRKIKRPNGYDLYDVMSSRLTNVHTHPLVPNAKGSEFIMGYNEKCSFGRIDFDTTAENPTLTFSIVNIDGETKGSHTLTLKDLSFPK